jgi:hypothetical protein
MPATTVRNDSAAATPSKILAKVFDFGVIDLERFCSDEIDEDRRDFDHKSLSDDSSEEQTN